MLEIKNITKNYARKKILDDISFNVKKGQIFGLLGPNGAGKTTLIRIINNIIIPDKGIIFLEGKKIQKKDIIKIGYLPEERGLYPKMKVGEQLMFLLALKGMSKIEAKTELKKLFEEFEIGTWWNKKLNTLSKGMQQKLQFIFTIANKPRLLILDEPFSGFDPLNTNIVLKKILELKNQGTTIMLSTHRMESVEELCEDIVIIDKAKKVLQGNTRKLKQHFKQNIFSIKLDGNKENLDIKNQYFQILDNNNNNLTLKIKNNSEINNVLKYFIDNKFIIREFTEVLPSMQEIFISQIKN